MKIAILICGEPRAIVFNEQIQFFTSLYNSLVKDGHTLDTYCMFKLNPKADYIQSEEGLSNFSKLIEVLKPRYLEFFYEFKEDQWLRTNFKEIYPPLYFSQIKMIDRLITEANKSDYDLFIRMRPDCILKGILDLSSIDPNIVYTSIKCDAPGNDQFFYFSRNMLYKWWIPIIRPSLNYIRELSPNSKLCPEYFIFNHCEKKQVIGSGLIRDYNKITSWVEYPGKPMVIDGFWKDEESYKKMAKNIEQSVFLEKLSVYNCLMNTDIPV
jgi:hypothetical protein